jgi:hypothetical protein
MCECFRPIEFRFDVPSIEKVSMVCGDGEKGECEVKVVRPVRKESNWSREIGKKRRGYRKGDSYLLSTQ